MSQVPPPFQPTPEYRPTPRPGPNPAILILAVFGGLCCLGSGLMFAMVQGMKGPVTDTFQCSFRAGITSAVIEAYAKRTGAYPAAATWQDDVKPDYQKVYDKLKTEGKKIPFFGGMMSLNDPSEPISCSTNKVVTGFAYNDEIAGKKVGDPSINKQTVEVFETNAVELNNHGAWSKESGKKFVGPRFEGKPRARILIKVGSKAGTESFNVDMDDGDSDTSGKNSSDTSGKDGADGKTGSTGKNGANGKDSDDSGS